VVVSDGWADLQKTNPGSTIDFKVTLDYIGDSKVPDVFHVSYRVDGGEWEEGDMLNVL